MRSPAAAGLRGRRSRSARRETLDPPGIPQPSLSEASRAPWLHRHAGSPRIIGATRGRGRTMNANFFHVLDVCPNGLTGRPAASSGQSPRHRHACTAPSWKRWRRLASGAARVSPTNTTRPVPAGPACAARAWGLAMSGGRSHASSPADPAAASGLRRTSATFPVIGWPCGDAMPPPRSSGSCGCFHASARTAPPDTRTRSYTAPWAPFKSKIRSTFHPAGGLPSLHGREKECLRGPPKMKARGGREAARPSAARTRCP